MTRISNKKEKIYLCMWYKGVESVEKVEGKQLLDYPDAYYVRFDGKYQIIHRPTGLAVVRDTNKKDMLEQWERIIDRYEDAIKSKRLEEHIKKFQKLIKEYEE